MPVQVGHYGPEDLQFILEHDGTVLAEINDVQWGLDPKVEPGGAGIGDLKNKYYKTMGPAAGSWKINRNVLQRSDKGMLFLDLLTGSSAVQEEAIAASAATYTVNLNTAMVSILEIRLNTSLVVLREGLDYTVNYVTGVITFAASTPEAATIRYLVSTRKLQQTLINGSFEDALTNIWTLVGTATIARNSVAANVLTGSYALAVTPAAVGDGFQYNISQNLYPGRQYRVRMWMKAAAAETIQPFWYDGTTDQAMTPATLAALTTTYAAYEATFTPTKSVVPNLKFKDSKTGPGLFYVDQIQMFDDTTANNPTIGDNPMHGGLNQPFTFNIIARRVVDGVTVFKLMRCAITGKLDYKGSSKAIFTEDVSGDFLDIIRE